MKTRVLYVEDEAILAIAMEGAMLDHGFDVQLAHDGDDGIAQGRDFQPQVIVTDYMMPRIDGLTMIRELRKIPAHMGVPVIFLTTESDGDLRAQAKAAGATGWLTKPFDPENLVKIARKVLGR